VNVTNIRLCGGYISHVAISDHKNIVKIKVMPTMKQYLSSHNYVLYHSVEQMYTLCGIFDLNGWLRLLVVVNVGNTCIGTREKRFKM